ACLELNPDCLEQIRISPNRLKRLASLPVKPMQPIEPIESIAWRPPRRGPSRPGHRDERHQGQGQQRAKKAEHVTEKGFLTPNEVASLLMVSPITVRQWAQKGLLEAQTTAGGHRRFSREVIEA